MRKTLIWISAALSVLGGSPARADPAAVADLVSRTWFEGIPIEEAAGLDAADGIWLAEQLADPNASAQHGNIAIALGACGCGPAFEALASFASATVERDGQTGPNKALRALPQAMGLLSQRDPRALAWLQARASRAPAKTDSPEERRLYALVLQGLAQSGTRVAGRQLTEIEAQANARGDAAAARWARQALYQWRQKK